MKNIFGYNIVENYMILTRVEMLYSIYMRNVNGLYR